MLSSRDPFLRADSALTGVLQDQLGRAEFAGHLAQRLLQYQGPNALMVGICGPWGSGKTSFVNMVLEAMTEKEKEGGRRAGTLIKLDVVSPWALPMGGHAGVAVIKAIGDGIGERTDEAALATVGGLAKRLATVLEPSDSVLTTMLTEATGLGSLARVASASAKATGAALEGAGAAPSPEALRKQISATLSTENSLLVVVLDDLERMPSTAVQQLFATVTNTANFSNTVFILCMDRIRVADALAGQHGDGAAFLEKFTHLTFDLPSADTELAYEHFINELQKVLASRDDDVSQPNTMARVQEFWENGLSGLITTPRDVVRLMNSYDLALDIIGKEVNAADLLALEAIRITHPAVYKALPGWERALVPIQTTTYDHLTMAMLKELKPSLSTTKSIAERLREVTHKPPEATESVALSALLQRLFPKPKDVSAQLKAARAQRISSNQYFSHYFRWSVGHTGLSHFDFLEMTDQLLGCQSDAEIAAWFSDHGSHYRCWIRRLHAHVVLPKGEASSIPSVMARRLLQTVHFMPERVPRDDLRIDLARQAAISLIGGPNAFLENVPTWLQHTQLVYGLTMQVAYISDNNPEGTGVLEGVQRTAKDAARQAVHEALLRTPSPADLEVKMFHLLLYLSTADNQLSEFASRALRSHVALIWAVLAREPILLAPAPNTGTFAHHEARDRLESRISPYFGLSELMAVAYATASSPEQKVLAERIAKILPPTVTSEAKELLDILTSNLLETKDPTTGFALRKQHGIVDPEKLAQERPDLFVLNGTPPQDHYRPTLQGALISSKGLLIERFLFDTIRFFKQELGEEPNRQSYKWSQLEPFVAPEFELGGAVALRLLQLLNIARPGQASGDKFSAAFPLEVEALLAVYTTEEFLGWHEQSSHRSR